MPVFFKLLNKTILSLSGESVIPFLQGLVSCDVTNIEEKPQFGALLSPQGKILYDFILTKSPMESQQFLLICDREYVDDFFKKLRLYRLRQKINLSILSERDLYFCTTRPTEEDRSDQSPLPKSLLLLGKDPRHPMLGYWYSTHSEQENDNAQTQNILPIADDTEFHQYLLSFGIPESPMDVIPNKTTLLEAGYDDLGAVSYKKGCYIGQEVTARMHYRGLLKRKLLGFKIIKGTVTAGEILLNVNNQEIGKITSCSDSHAMCHIKIALLSEEIATEAGATLTPLSTLEERPA